MTVFGEERLAQDAGHEADRLETLKLKRATLALMNDEHALHNEKLAYRALDRQFQPPVEIFLLSDIGKDEVAPSPTAPPLARADLRLTNLVYENVHAPQSVLARLILLEPRLLYTATEGIYFDDDNKGWVVRKLVYPYKKIRDAIRGEERESVMAIKPLSQNDIEKAYELLASAAREDTQIHGNKVA